jgi:hypothetical protein
MMWIRRSGLGLPDVLFNHITAKSVSMSQDLMRPSIELEILLALNALLTLQNIQ